MAEIILEQPQTLFKFKASFAPCTILQMTGYDLSLFHTREYSVRRD
jgi:hypothetical protein